MPKIQDVFRQHCHDKGQDSLVFLFLLFIFILFYFVLFYVLHFKKHLLMIS